MKIGLRLGLSRIQTRHPAQDRRDDAASSEGSGRALRWRRALHALTDALLGAVAAPDIGTLFSPSDQRWKGADSRCFWRKRLTRVRAAGYAVVNVDSTLILAAPKIGPHASAIREHVAELLGIPADRVGLKAKTPEGMGTDNAAIAHSVVLLEKIKAKQSGVRKSKK